MLQIIPIHQTVQPFEKDNCIPFRLNFMYFDVISFKRLFFECIKLIHSNKFVDIFTGFL